MTSQMITVKLPGRSVVLACPPRVSMPGSGLSSTALLPVLPVRERNERPTQAPAVVAAKAQAQAYAFAAAANGADAGIAQGAAGANGHANGQQKTQQHGKWAFRGLEPWSDPA